MERLLRCVGGRKPLNKLSSRQKRRVNSQIRPKIPLSARSEDIDFRECNGSSNAEATHSCTLTHITSFTSVGDGEPTNSMNSPPYIFEDSVRSISSSSNPTDDEFDEEFEFEDEDKFEDKDEFDNSFDRPSSPSKNVPMTARDNAEAGPSYDSFDADTELGSFRERLATCFVENKLSHQACDSILALLRSHPCFLSLPKSAKTLLNTPTQPVTLQKVFPGEYLHIGFEKALLHILEIIPPQEIPLMLEVDTSTDGGAIDNSGKNQIWPLQCRVANIKNSPTEVIGIYKGPKKPQDATDFLRFYVEEAKKIISEGGVIFKSMRISITLRAFIADGPARAFILNHKGHNARRACAKCKVEGQSVDRHMAFCGVDHPHRTGEEYHQRIDEDHHKEGVSPLSFLPIDMVKQVPFDYMHLVCLGVVKRLLSAWLDGKFSFVSKLCANEIKLISLRLEYLTDKCPQEFARRPRSIEQYARYKATEFRQFLLYTGPVVLEGILKPDIYKHFLLLHSSIRILASDNPSKAQLVFAREALKIFVLRSETYYGTTFLSYNVHGLLHLVDDVELFGPVDNYSAFPYENNMKIFRDFCRKPGATLQQIAFRTAENNQWHRKNQRRQSGDDIPVVSYRHNEGPIPVCTFEPGINQYRRVKCRRFVLDIAPRDCCFIMKDASVGIVVNVVLQNDEVYLVVKKYDYVESFFDVSIPSSSIGYYKCSRLRDELKIVPFANVDTKGYLMPHWTSHRFDQYGKELLVDGEFIVAAMSCTINY